MQGDVGGEGLDLQFKDDGTTLEMLLVSCDGRSMLVDYQSAKADQLLSYMLPQKDH